MQPPVPSRQLLIQGITPQGTPFRPSDWAERLAGIMAHFQPPQKNQKKQPPTYSPFVKPITLNNGIKCILLDEQLKNIEPKAFHFILNFARDNNLNIIEPNTQT